MKIKNMSLTWFESMRGKWGKEESPPIGEKKRGKKVLLANLFFRAEEGRYINTQKKEEVKRKKMKKTNMAAIGIIAVFACLLCLLLCTPALADPYCGGLNLTTVKEGTVSGGLWFDHSNPMVTNWTKDYTLPSYTDMQWARLYVAVYCGHMQKNYPGRVNITFNGAQLGGTADGLSSEEFDVCYTYPSVEYTEACVPSGIGYNDAPGPGNGPEWVNDHCVRVTSDYLMWYNVTDLVQPESDVWIEAWRKYPEHWFDGRIVVVTLVVAYNDGDSGTIRYRVNQGHDVDSNYWDDQGGPNYIGETNFTVDLPIGSTIENVNLTVVHKASTDGAYTFNGISTPTDPDSTTTPPGENWQGAYSGYNIWYATDMFNSTGNNTLTYDRIGSFYKIVLAFLIVKAEPIDKPDLNITDINAYHYHTGESPWFNLSNEVDVTVKNNGSASAGASTVCLYIDDAPFGKLPVPGLNPGDEHTVTFTGWKPIGADCLQPICVFDWSYHDYSFKGVADCDGNVAESNETNNETTVVERVCYNGYMADEPLENVAQGTIHGHILFTTGDGSYGALNSPDDTRATNYEITLPESATVEHAQLNVYYTWTSPDHACPEMEVSITNATGTYVVPLEKAYNDIKCTCPGTMYVKSWGNYVFNIAPYVTGSGTYTVTVKNVGPLGHKFCIAAPGIVLVYADESAPLIDYWVNKGADLLIGGRRADGGYLSLQECINNATFPASTTTDTVETATLGVVAPWGDNAPNDVLYFNGVELGSGVYNGYSNPYSEEIDSITMSVGGSNAQVGVDVTDVTAQYHKGSENVVGQGDDGDNMMPANAFLVVAYVEEEEPDLNVSEITVNYDAPGLGGRAVGPEPGDGVHTQCNNISAVIEEDNGEDVESPFDVTFEVDGTTLCTVRVPGLTGGANKTVYCNCSWYPVAGDAFAINVTVDSNDEILESDETNNTMWNNGTVISNGYKGDGWQGPDMNLTNVQCHDQDTINLTYSVGDSYYLSGATLWTEYTANWTASDLPVPGDATIEKAILYVYYTWDKAGVMPDNVDLKFNDNDIPLARHYTDRKGFGGYDYPAGMLVYNVLDKFTATGNNKAVLTKPVAADEVSMRGMLLMVVYKHPDEPERIICIDEGYDMLYAKDSYAVSSEEATTYAPFTCCEPIPLGEIVKATLIAVAPSASDGDDKNRLSFNTGLWKGIWDHYEAGTQLGIAEAEVLAHLKATDNLANFQSHIPAGGDKGDCMEASNAFLILEKKVVVVVTAGIDCGTICSDPSCRTILPITLYRIEDYGSGTINLFYDHAAVDVVDATGSANSALDAWNKITNGHIAISAHNAQGVSGDIIFANVKFAPKGLPPQCSDLNLTVTTLYDTSYVPLPYETDNCTICILEGEPPFVTNPQADPVVILNDNGRARVPGTNVSMLGVHVSDDTGVSSVAVNLTPIRGPGHDAVAMTLVSGTNKNGDWAVSTNADYDSGVNLTHCLKVNATDVHGNSNIRVCITITVLRRGDVVRDNLVDMGDALYIARSTVGLEPAPDEFVAGVVPADSYDGVDMADALYIARKTVGLEPAP